MSFYELLEPIAHGHVAQVWRASTTSGRPCAVKFPIEALAAHRGAARSIEREWEFLGRAAQTGVVGVLGLEAESTGPALVLEYLPGGDLVALAGSHPRHWARAMRDVVRVVEALHDRGIVHCDLKPRNVRFDAHGRATLLDFALAHEIGQRRLIGTGTTAYQRTDARGARAQPATDVYAVAAMIFELLCGALPFGRDGAAERASAGERTAVCGRLEALGEATGARALARGVAAVLSGEREDATALAEMRDALDVIINVPRA